MEIIDESDGGDIITLPAIQNIQRRHRPSKQLVAKHWRAMAVAQGDVMSQFQNIMAVASDLQDSPSALLGIVRLFGLHLQSVSMTQVFRQPKTPAVGISDSNDIFFDTSWPLSQDGKTLDDLAPQQEIAVPLDMRNDTILPWPWHQGRAIDALHGLSKGGKWGAWQSTHNHSVELWLPMRLGIVFGGNHSLMAGIALGNTGPLLSDATRDISKVYPYVKCDGQYWLRMHDGKVIGTVPSLEAAVIWEIGRLLC